MKQRIWLVLFLHPAWLFARQSAEADSSMITVFIPKYSWSAGIHYASVPNVFYNQLYVPDNFEVTWWIHNRLYMQAGMFLISADEDTYAGWYTGASLKLYLFPQAYLNPVVNVYVDFFNPANEKENLVVSLGPCIGFEYFISNRFSVRADVADVGFGIRHYEGGGNEFTVSNHRLLGIGLRYNFDW